MTIDVLGAPYTAETIPLPDDHEGPVVATLVRRAADSPTRKAVLHVHGFADYFFQTEYAQWWTDHGYDFYAVDLPKYGRSMLPHQTPNFTTDLRDYYPVLDEVWQRIRADHDAVIVTGHSTGGLTTPLWVDDRQPDGLAGMFLNSPWLDMQGPAAVRLLGTPVINRLGKLQPMRVIPRSVSGFYTRSLHRDHEGEWDFNLVWKPVESFTVHAGWLRAIRAGHAAVHAGLDVRAPVLVLSSGTSAHPAPDGTVDEIVHGSDIVLDVAQIRRWSTAIGPHVTYAAIEGAKHDVVLSAPPVRAKAYEEIGRWLTAYVEG
ncbi:alpha/beta hydrolase [Nocardioides nematodiphilus]|uniref:alpha/beta hydrolase n=1 Tax=Nocardioides nematodiphilus TaxID=2849669 RepID=UPI001CDA2836|nr:alpha/beta hydrolase [Nocardioides nematodiphilus]MCA1981903.1 alpha/beta hydrolase [Nocardioides nematodiphilus]